MPVASSRRAQRRKWEGARPPPTATLMIALAIACYCEAVKAQTFSTELTVRRHIRDHAFTVTPENCQYFHRLAEVARADMLRGNSPDKAIGICSASMRARNPEFHPDATLHVCNDMINDQVNFLRYITGQADWVR